MGGFATYIIKFSKYFIHPTTIITKSITNAYNYVHFNAKDMGSKGKPQE